MGPPKSGKSTFIHSYIKEGSSIFSKHIVELSEPVMPENPVHIFLILPPNCCTPEEKSRWTQFYMENHKDITLVTEKL
jgi:hypothetical protein